LAAAEQDLNQAGNPEAPAAEQQKNKLINWKPKPKPSRNSRHLRHQNILQSGLSGLCGLVAQLGRVEPRYQLAMETAAGGVGAVGSGK